MSNYPLNMNLACPRCGSTNLEINADVSVFYQGPKKEVTLKDNCYPEWHEDSMCTCIDPLCGGYGGCVRDFLVPAEPPSGVAGFSLRPGEDPALAYLRYVQWCVENKQKIVHTPEQMEAFLERLAARHENKSI